MAKNNRIIGSTSLKKLKGIGFDYLELFLKDESENPSGTIKDRRNEYVVREASRLGVDKLALISAGNNAYSLAQLAGQDIQIAALVDRSLPEDLKEALRSWVYQLVEINLQSKILRPEEVVAFTREREDEVIWDVTNGYEEGYASVVAELRELEPDYIVVPIGSGGIYVGVVDAVRRYRLPTKVIGIGVQNTFRSYADKLHTPWTPYTKVMANYHTQGHTIYRLTESEVKETWQKYQHMAQMEPSSSVVFAALDKHPFEKGEKVVLINTGCLNLN